MHLINNGNPYVCDLKDRRRTYSLWERFNAGVLGVDELVEDYERLMFMEWDRCRKMGIDATMKTGKILSKEKYREIREEKKYLIDNATPILDSVQDLLFGVPGILLFTDEEGTILHISGDLSVREKAAATINLVQGSRWCESVVGINGIGTAIAKRCPVHVFSAEHYCEGWHTWTCAGTPIFDPLSNDVLGVVDFTTFDRDYRNDAVDLIGLISKHISNDLRLRLEIERLQLIHQYELESSHYPSDAVIVLDRTGRVVRCSPTIDPSTFIEKNGCAVDFTALAPKAKHAVCTKGDGVPIGTLLVVAKRKGNNTANASKATGVSRFGGFITASRTMKNIMARIEKIIPTELSILVTGETGTGKELITNYIHRRSERRDGPYVTVNCGAISKELFESRFFGYVHGAFTGADPRGKRGFFESADQGTLFLDEIGEMPLDIQVALLRVLETKRFSRIGSERELTADFRIVAATNRFLLKEVEKGTFREDLYYRLSMATIVIPPLRYRQEDIPVLVEHMATAFCQKYHVPQKSFSADAMETLIRYQWPGNCRELRNVVEATFVYSGDPIMCYDLPAEVQGTSDHLAGGIVPSMSPLVSSADLNLERALRTQRQWNRHNERQMIEAALKKNRHLSQAARELGISRSTLYRRLREFDIELSGIVRSRRKLMATS